jgi:hypothetical protein
MQMETLQKLRDLGFSGIRIVANQYMPESISRQYKFPRSKKARIRKKWARNPKYRREVPVVWQVDGVIMVHPKIYERIKERFSKAA